MITRPATSSINPTAHAHTATEKPADNKSKGKPKSWTACVCALTSRRGWPGNCPFSTTARHPGTNLKQPKLAGENKLLKAPAKTQLDGCL